MRTALLATLFLFALTCSFGQSDTIYVSYNQSVVDFFSLSAQKALEQGVLTKDLKKKQPAEIRFNGNLFEAKVRMKGDWLDHVKENQWSLRVNLKEGNVYMAEKFSLQFPETRGGDNERVFHQELQKYDILTPHYVFVHLVVNDEYWGRFAFEEHFDEPLLERYSRSDGPILKFDEEGFWECQMLSKKLGQEVCVEYPLLAAAKIDAFGKKTKKDATKFARFRRGRAILDTWRRDSLPLDKLDLKRFAHYYALCDIFGFYHGLQWHNQRFYYRPADGRLEPIAYDCFSENNELIGKDFLGFFDEHYATVYFHEQWFNYQLFRNAEFRSFYKGFLRAYTENEEWKKSGASPELFAQLKERARKLSVFIEQEQELPQYYPYERWKKENPDLIKEYDIDFSNELLEDVSFNAVSSSSGTIITNFHMGDLKVLGYTNERGFYALNDQIKISSGTSHSFDWNDAKHVFGVYNLNDSVRRKVILSHDIEDNTDASWKDYFEENRDGWIWKKELLELNESIELPAGNVYCIDSAEIHFKEFGLITCFGDLNISASKLLSSGTGNMGIRALDGKLSVSNTSLIGFDVPVQQANSPLQALNCEVVLSNLQLESIRAEDAINLVNCRATIKGLTLMNCSGDGLDADFCQLELSKLSVYDCGGDGVDVSFSIASLKELEIANCVDKGISVGEASEVRLLDARISDCASGVAVKDKASLFLDRSIGIVNCTVLINAFRKKSFFIDGGTVYLNGNDIKVQYDLHSKVHVE